MKKVFLSALLMLVLQLAQAQKKEQIILSIDHNESLPAQLERTQRDLSAGSRGNRGLVSMGIGLAANIGTRTIFQLIDNANAKYVSSWSAPAGRDFFYEGPSFLGPLDPTGLHFSGITLVREEIDADGNTGAALFVRCSLPEDRLEEYVTSRRFDLKIDTLAIDLSRVKAKYTAKKTISIQIGITFKATWMDENLEIHKDQTLGMFNICLPALKYDPANPVVTFSADKAKPLISGSCFFIPRSYSAFVSGNEYRNCWSAGEFEVVLNVNESTAGKKNKNADYVRQYIEGALPGALQQVLSNEQVSGSSVSKIIKNY